MKRLKDWLGGHKKELVGFALATALGGVGVGIERGMALVDWKQNVDERGYRADEADRYLNEVIATTKDGKPVRRRDVLDVLIGRALQPPPSPTK